MKEKLDVVFLQTFKKPLIYTAHSILIAIPEHYGICVRLQIIGLSHTFLTEDNLYLSMDSVLSMLC